MYIYKMSTNQASIDTASKDDNNLLLPVLMPFEQTVLKILACIKCQNPSIGSIYHCTKGHLYCQNCGPKLSRCSICKSKISAKRTHCVENIVGCILSKCNLGSTDAKCSRLLVTRELENHQKYCQKTKMICPLKCDCNFLDNRNNLKRHCIEIHRQNVIVFGKFELIIFKNAFSSLSSWIINEKSNLFIRLESGCVFAIDANHTLYKFIVEITDNGKLLLYFYHLSMPNETDEFHQVIVTVEDANAIFPTMQLFGCCDNDNNCVTLKNTFLEIDMTLYNTDCVKCLIEITKIG